MAGIEGSNFIFSCFLPQYDLPVEEDALDEGDDGPGGVVPGADDGDLDALARRQPLKGVGIILRT